MVAIRVRPDMLHSQAKTLEQISSDVRHIGEDMLRAASNQPSYDGQFGPRVLSIGREALSRSQRFSSQMSSRHVDLNQRASRFEAVDAMCINKYTTGTFNTRTVKPLLMINGWLQKNLAELRRFYPLGKLTFQSLTSAIMDSHEFPDWANNWIGRINKIGDVLDAGFKIVRLNNSDKFKHAITISGSDWYKKWWSGEKIGQNLINADKYAVNLIKNANKINLLNVVMTGVSLVSAWTEDFFTYKDKGIAYLGAAFSVDAGLEAISRGASLKGMIIGAKLGTFGGPVGIAVGAIVGGVLGGWAVDYVTKTNLGDMIVDVSGVVGSSVIPIPIFGANTGREVGETVVGNLLSPELAETSLKDVAIEVVADGINAGANLIQDGGGFMQGLLFPSTTPVDLIIEPTIQMACQ